MVTLIRFLIGTALFTVIAVPTLISLAHDSGSLRPDSGQPLMLPPVKGVAFGVSVSPENPTAVFVWMNNQTNDVQSYEDVCNVSFSKAFVLYDLNGHRLLTKAEEESRRHSPDEMEVEVCSCCILMAVKPHTTQVVDSGDLTVAYSLSSGRYSLVPVDSRNGIPVVVPEKK